MSTTPTAEPLNEPAAGEPATTASTATEPSVIEAVDDELTWESALAFGIEGFDPEDPWNAVLAIEGETIATALPLTPRHLEFLVDRLDEVRVAQLAALGMPPDHPSRDETDGPGSGDHEESGPVERPPTGQRIARLARLASGAEPVSRLWNESRRGRMTIIIGALIFIALGVILSVAS